MKIGIVGAGFMARTHLSGWRAIGEDVVAAFSPEEDSAAAFSAETGIPSVFGMDDLMSRCDIIDVCSPTATHAEHVLAAVHAGKPVFCEKPLARTHAEAEKMIREAEAAQVALGVGHVVRFFPEYARALATVRSGGIGDVAVARFSRCGFRPKGAWYRDTNLSGGVILDLMIHDLDFARLVCGPVVSVFAWIDDTGPGPHAAAILSHQSGAISHVEGSWRLPPPSFTTAFELAGSTALITFDSTESSALSARLGPASGDLPDVPVAASPVAEDPYALELRAFRDAVTAGNAVPVDGREGLATLDLAFSAIRSAETGLPQEVQI